MRAAVLSPPSWALGAESPITERANVISRDRVLFGEWDKNAFAEEQVRGLVRQVFSAALKPAVQQVVFCGVEAETDVESLCTWTGEILSEERVCEVALVDEKELVTEWASEGEETHFQSGSLRQFGTRIRRNLWFFPATRHTARSGTRSISGYLNELRKEFEYSIVVAPAAAASSKVLELASFADGVVLVLSAQRTRRITALRVRSALAHVRLLGTVLSDREFPMPSSLYRRL
jgi:hypothetical protein